MWTVPNMITMGRIAFCPVLAGLIVTSQHELALAGEGKGKETLRAARTLQFLGTDKVVCGERCALRGPRKGCGCCLGSGCLSPGCHAVERWPRGTGMSQRYACTAVGLVELCHCYVLSRFSRTDGLDVIFAPGLLAASLTDWLDGYIARRWNQKASISSCPDFLFCLLSSGLP